MVPACLYCPVYNPPRHPEGFLCNRPGRNRKSKFQLGLLLFATQENERVLLHTVVGHNENQPHRADNIQYVGLCKSSDAESKSYGNALFGPSDAGAAIGTFWEIRPTTFASADMRCESPTFFCCL